MTRLEEKEEVVRLVRGDRRDGEIIRRIMIETPASDEPVLVAQKLSAVFLEAVPLGERENAGENP